MVTIDGGGGRSGSTRTPVDFTTKEFDLLRFLAERPGLALSRQQILDGVWGYDWFGDVRTVDVHIAQVRKKLGDACTITTVRGVGYRMDSTQPRALDVSQDAPDAADPARPRDGRDRGRRARRSPRSPRSASPGAASANDRAATARGQGTPGRAPARGARRLRLRHPPARGTNAARSAGSSCRRCGSRNGGRRHRHPEGRGHRRRASGSATSCSRSRGTRHCSSSPTG